MTTASPNKPTEELVRYKKLVADLQQKALDEFDFDAIFAANDTVRNFFEKWDNQDGVKLMDRMTNVMKNLKVLVDFVKARRKNAEMSEQEMREYQQEVQEVSKLLQDMMSL